jgi:hypothetical protein
MQFIMKKLSTICLLLAFSLPAFSQGKESEAIKKVINTLFDSMRSGDTLSLRSTFADGMVMQVLKPQKDKPDTLVMANVNDFVKKIGAPHADVYDERVVFDSFNMNNNIATVWAPYKFYLGKKFSHCGIDIFQMMKTKEGWKIVSIYYDVRTGNCP